MGDDAPTVIEKPYLESIALATVEAIAAWTVRLRNTPSSETNLPYGYTQASLSDAVYAALVETGGGYTPVRSANAHPFCCATCWICTFICVTTASSVVMSAGVRIASAMPGTSVHERFCVVPDVV